LSCVGGCAIGIGHRVGAFARAGGGIGCGRRFDPTLRERCGGAWVEAGNFYGGNSAKRADRSGVFHGRRSVLDSRVEHGASFFTDSPGTVGFGPITDDRGGLVFGENRRAYGAQFRKSTNPIFIGVRRGVDRSRKKMKPQAATPSDASGCSSMRENRALGNGDYGSWRKQARPADAVFRSGFATRRHHRRQASAWAKRHARSADTHVCRDQGFQTRRNRRRSDGFSR